MENNRVMARKLRLAVVTNVWRQGKLSDGEAKEILSGPLTPGDPSSIVDDSGLLGDPDGLDKCAAQHPMQPSRGERPLPVNSASDLVGGICLDCRYANTCNRPDNSGCFAYEPPTATPTDKVGPSSPAPCG